MAILGNIIKKVIEFKGKLTPEESAIAAQEKVLRELLHRAQETEFGRHYNFQELLKSSDLAHQFSESVPLHDFNKIHSEWWHKTEQGKADVTWPGKPRYLALSSGTTNGNSKRIPVTEEMLQATRKTSLQQITALANFDLPAEFFEKEVMMLCSSTNLKNNGIFEEGEISGINAGNIPFWFKNYCRPGDDILSTDNWDERIQKIAEQAAYWDIGALSGIPSWIELMLKKVISYNGLNTIHDIWPNLEVYATGGVAFGPYRKGFEKLLARPLTYIDTYFTSEGYLAFQSRPETQAMTLATDNGIYFEFIPFTEENVAEDGTIKPGAPSLTLADIVEDEEYVLILSTVSGAWRYIIGDTIKLVDKDYNEIAITGRTSHFLNVVGSKLSVGTMNVAMQELEKHLSITIEEFTVSAVLKEDEYSHQWYIGTSDTANAEKAAGILDNTLQRLNRNYRTARRQALKHVDVKFIPPEVFYDWSEVRNKKGGQVKTPRVLKQEQFTEWENFVRDSVEKYSITR